MRRPLTDLETELDRLQRSGRGGTRASISYAYRRRDGVVASQPLGAELAVVPIQLLRLMGRVSYDLERELWARAEVLGQWRPNCGTCVVWRLRGTAFDDWW